MINNLIQYFESQTALSAEERQFLIDHIELRRVLKNEILLSQGQISREFYFMLKGIVRLYYLKDVAEKTAFFYTENSFVSSYESFIRQSPAKHNLQAIEETHLAVISYDLAYEILDKFPKFEFLARMMMEEELIIYQDIISSFITLSAEERYLKLLKDQSEIIQRVPQHQLATYLGVSAETLSRIRRRIVS